MLHTCKMGTANMSVEHHLNLNGVYFVFVYQLEFLTITTA